MTNLLSIVINWATTAGIKVIIALAVLFIGFSVINTLCKKITRNLEQSGKFDITLTKTFSHAIQIGLKVLLAVCLVGYLGIETSSISAMIASLSVCVGLAINGTLSNLAGGVMIILTRPFKLGDYISAQGQDGVVEAINICATKIVTVDNKVVYLPNSALSTGVIVNFSEKDLRRVDLTFSIAGNDPAKVRSIIFDVCEKQPLVLADPAPFAKVVDYGAGNGVKMQLRAWCNSSTYWDTYFALLSDMQTAFEANGIVIPFNQLDVHMKN